MIKTNKSSNPKRAPIWGWKFLFVIAAYIFLAYKLFTFNHYPALLQQWKQLPVTQFWWLIAVFLLLPINWILESWKWKLLVKNIQQLTFLNSVKAVLAGISTGFATPNRIGEFAGRIMFLKNENQKAGLTMSLVNSLTQNLIMALCGIPACILFFFSTTGKIQPDLILYLQILLAGLFLLSLSFLFLPNIFSKIKKEKIYTKIGKYIECLSEIKRIELFRILLISLFRYFVFCLQFFFMLRFFGINLTVFQVLLAIPTIYLFVTFTPSVSISEAAVRSSYAVLIISVFSIQIVNIALAGVCIWLVNFVIPMLLGTVVMVLSKK